MSELTIAEHAEIVTEHRESDEKTTFGFWIYIMTDCVLFASLFAVYAVLHGNTFGGPGGHKLFDASSALAETLILLTSSFTCGLAMLATKAKNKKLTIIWFAVTALLGLAFLGIEIKEFTGLVSGGNGWSHNAFLSSFFVLVGTHGLHITVGLAWIIAILIKLAKKDFTRSTTRRLKMLSYFWHFLDVVWIFIFTVVYMLGVA